MSEIIKAKYIDLMVDWSFKRVFGTEVNKDILIEFLKVVFPQFAITDITYIPTEQLGIMEDDRKAIFDVLCKTEDGKTFLVELQRGAQEHFFLALHAASLPETSCRPQSYTTHRRLPFCRPPLSRAAP